MDGRRALALAAALGLGALGCTTTSSSVGFPTADDGVRIVKEPELPPRPPKPETCVALGAFSERTADEPACGLAERVRLREQARKAYQQALQLDPKDLGAATALARLYEKIDDHSHAVATYKKALDQHPQEAPVWHELGMCHAKAREWDLAITALRKAVDIEPESRPFNHDLGFCLARAGRFDESVAAFARQEGEAVAHYNVGRMLHHLKHDDLCREHLLAALARKPDYAEAKELLTKLDAPAAKPATLPADFGGDDEN